LAGDPPTQFFRVRRACGGISAENDGGPVEQANAQSNCSGDFQKIATIKG
jgi:hypothetical protein